MDVIEKALQVASKAHKGQVRKLTDIPYISHPVAVGMVLVKAGCKDELVAAGILHDTVEDTDVTLEDIKRDFGEKIAEIVEGCSEPDKSAPWKERKEHTIDYLKSASIEIRTVVCADKLHNIRSIIDDHNLLGDQVWEKFNAGKASQEWYYRSLVESLGYASHFPLIEELQVEVDRLFSDKPRG